MEHVFFQNCPRTHDQVVGAVAGGARGPGFNSRSLFLNVLNHPTVYKVIRKN